MHLTTRIFLWVMSAMSLVFGAMYLVVPTTMTDSMGYGTLAMPAVTDIRAAFGGFQLGTGLFLVACLRRQRVLTGLMLVFLQAFAFVICRSYGLLVDGELTPNLAFALAQECALSLGAITLYLLYPRDEAVVTTPIAPRRGARVFVIVVGLVLLVSGVISALDPVRALGPMGFGPMTPAALTDMRAGYGGFQVGLAAFLLWCARPGRLFAALLAMAISIGLVLACRVIGLVLDGAITGALIGAVVFELVLTLIATIMCVRTGGSAWTSD